MGQPSEAHGGGFAQRPVVELAALGLVGARGGAPRCARRLGGGAPRARTCSAWPSARRRPRAPGAAARARFVRMPSAWVSGGAVGIGALGGFGVRASMCPCPFVSLHPAASPRSVAICAVPSTSASLLSSVLLTTGVLFGVRPRLATRGPEVNRPSRAGVPVPVHGGGGLSQSPPLPSPPRGEIDLRDPKSFQPRALAGAAALRQSRRALGVAVGTRLGASVPPPHLRSECTRDLWVGGGGRCGTPTPGYASV